MPGACSIRPRMVTGASSEVMPCSRLGGKSSESPASKRTVDSCACPSLGGGTAAQRSMVG
eukprot:39097-Prorocentrum_minimum.AAC.1